MATANHGITVPTVGGSSSTWGVEANLCFTTLDGRMPSLTGLKIDGVTPLPFTGAQLFASGTVSAPGISFSADPDCGIYRIGANNLGLALNGAKVIDFAATTITFTAVPVGPTPAAGASGYASVRLPHGVAPTTNLVNGDLWTTTTALQLRLNGVTKDVAFTDSNITGSAGSCTGNAATATKWATARNLSLTGDVTATLSSVDGSAAVAAAATIANNAVTSAKIADDSVTNAKLANMAQATIKGRASGAGTGDPTDLTGAQAAAILNAAGSIDLSSATIGTTDTTGDGYLKIGPYYYQWGTSSSATKDGDVTVTLPYSSGTSFPIEGTIQATPRNLTGATNINSTASYKSSDATSITFFQSDISSSGTPQGFNWSCWTPA